MTKGNQETQHNTAPVTIYTIGHGNDTIEHFCAVLINADIDLLVDVRSAPYSRYKPEFNREKFRDELKKYHINYSYAGDKLGGRPTDAQYYKNGEIPIGQIDKSEYLKLVDYEALAQSTVYLDGIERLISHAKQRKVAIMCSEENPDHCHRKHLITKTLQKKDITVIHLRRNGTSITDSTHINEVVDSPKKEELPHQLSLF